MLIITDHAAIRYAERILNVDLREVRKICRKADVDPRDTVNQLLAIETMGHSPMEDFRAEMLACADRIRALGSTGGRIRVRKHFTIVVKNGTVITVLDEELDFIPPKRVYDEKIWSRGRRVRGLRYERGDAT